MKRSLRPRLGRVTVAACSIVGMSATALLAMGSPASAAPAPVCSGGGGEHLHRDLLDARRGAELGGAHRGHL
jgi:hypothetical protein